MKKQETINQILKLKGEQGAQRKSDFKRLLESRGEEFIEKDYNENIVKEDVRIQMALLEKSEEELELILNICKIHGGSVRSIKYKTELSMSAYTTQQVIKIVECKASIGVRYNQTKEFKNKQSLGEKKEEGSIQGIWIVYPRIILNNNNSILVRIMDAPERWRGNKVTAIHLLNGVITPLEKIASIQEVRQLKKGESIYNIVNFSNFGIRLERDEPVINFKGKRLYYGDKDKAQLVFDRIKELITSGEMISKTLDIILTDYNPIKIEIEDKNRVRNLKLENILSINGIATTL